MARVGDRRSLVFPTRQIWVQMPDLPLPVYVESMGIFAPWK